MGQGEDFAAPTRPILLQFILHLLHVTNGRANGVISVDTKDCLRERLTLFLGQDKRGFQQPSKDYIKFVRRQKRADEKRALKDFLYNDGPLRTFQHKDPIWSSNAEPPVGSRKRNEKAYARSAKKYHQDRIRSKLREESYTERLW
ncbi:hypothetical protein OIU79_030688 [Salix purpurea]|uniref:Uncharacterized protein n=1 Tax=Salix purpurea TaxID=77065 RepID=A0A9Q0V943_SALPP|nr:hypothetical protein OIU79_030688 [Salix purpurea]